MGNREIKYEGNWYRVGDHITLKNKLRFLFWELPIWREKKYVVVFIGSDCSALLDGGYGDEKTITGSVNIVE